MVFLAFLQQSQPNATTWFIVQLVIIFGIFYVVVMRPMQRQKQQHRQMLAGLQSGNIVQTSGGIIGTVVSRNDENDTLILRVRPDNIKIEVARSAVSGLISEK
jgi:preprotein translocase subunit YajC